MTWNLGSSTEYLLQQLRMLQILDLQEWIEDGRGQYNVQAMSYVPSAYVQLWIVYFPVPNTQFP